jgi:hypothetical protein
MVFSLGEVKERKLRRKLREWGHRVLLWLKRKQTLGHRAFWIPLKKINSNSMVVYNVLLSFYKYLFNTLSDAFSFRLSKLGSNLPADCTRSYRQIAHAFIGRSHTLLPADCTRLINQKTR